jgi:hypothetical protein
MQNVIATIVTSSPESLNLTSREIVRNIRNENGAEIDPSSSEIILANQSQGQENRQNVEILINNQDSPTRYPSQVQGVYIPQETNQNSTRKTLMARVLTVLGTGANILGITVANTDNSQDRANAYMLVILGATTCLIAGVLYCSNQRNQEQPSNPNTRIIIVNPDGGILLAQNLQNNQQQENQPQELI